MEKQSKTSETFNKTIKAYLDKRATQDQQFAQSYAKENKSIEGCCNYIINQVQKSGVNGFADEEIFGMAVHYYDEDDIKDVGATSCKVVVNHAVELTEDEKAELRKKAADAYEQEQLNALRQKKAKEEAQEKARIEKIKAKQEKANAQYVEPSLF
jgi:hypothetical protein